MPSLRSSTTMPTPYRRLRPHPRSGGSRPIRNRVCRTRSSGRSSRLPRRPRAERWPNSARKACRRATGSPRTSCPSRPCGSAGSLFTARIIDGKVPAGAIGIAVDAATAFGTGEHPSTRGCLLALERLARRRRFRRPLDIGTGTGIFSIAAAKLLHRKVLAGDIDPRAICVARHNAARNGVTGWCKAAPAPGYRDRLIRKSQLRFDPVQYPRAPIGGDGRRSCSAAGSRRTRRACRDCCDGRSRSCSHRIAAAASCSIIGWSSTGGRPW